VFLSHLAEFQTELDESRARLDAYLPGFDARYPDRRRWGRLPGEWDARQDGEAGK